jgi:hypothetical protein
MQEKMFLGMDFSETNGEACSNMTGEKARVVS